MKTPLRIVLQVGGIGYFARRHQTVLNADLPGQFGCTGQFDSSQTRAIGSGRRQACILRKAFYDRGQGGEGIV